MSNLLSYILSKLFLGGWMICPHSFRSFGYLTRQQGSSRTNAVIKPATHVQTIRGGHAKYGTYHCHNMLWSGNVSPNHKYSQVVKGPTLKALFHLQYAFILKYFPSRVDFRWWQMSTLGETCPENLLVQVRWWWSSAMSCSTSTNSAYKRLGLDTGRTWFLLKVDSKSTHQI
jgi:hypothetical protein